MTVAGGTMQMRGEQMFAVARELFPICRSITGHGLRETLRRLQREIPLQIHEVPSGTRVLDWIVPDEWNISEAWIADRSGRKLVDFERSNLHVVNYSVPFRGRVGWEELRKHLHTLPDRPDWVPYRTSYYKRNWGFCLAHRDLEQFGPGEYDVCVDSTLAPGSLSYGELLVRGESADEFLVSAHSCHPSLANDNLSGVVVATALARRIMEMPARRLSYRFLFGPGTIGAVTWLAHNSETVERIRHGLVLTCVGDRGPFTYKRSRQGSAAIDAAVTGALAALGEPHSVQDFSPYGYDERQFCSPGFNLPVGCLMRAEHGKFPEYHTSADNLDFIHPEALEQSLDLLTRVVDTVEQQENCDVAGGGQDPRQRRAARGKFFLNLKPHGEPQLGRYGVYEALRGDVMPALWVLNLSDGFHSLEEIARVAELPFDSVAKAADVLATVELVKEVEFSA